MQAQVPKPRSYDETRTFRSHFGGCDKLVPRKATPLSVHESALVAKIFILRLLRSWCESYLANARLRICLVICLLHQATRLEILLLRCPMSGRNSSVVRDRNYQQKVFGDVPFVRHIVQLQNRPLRTLAVSRGRFLTYHRRTAHGIPAEANGHRGSQGRPKNSHLGADGE
jgi:hypothetical protein